ncbi:MAG: DUF2807 domain-containing protein [Saprospiraceae bacterium]
MKSVRILIWPAIVGLWILLVSATTIYDDFHAFDQIRVSGPVELLLVPGEEASVSQVSNQDLSITIENKILKIVGREETTPAIIKVTYHTLRSIHAADGAMVTAVEAIPAKTLMINLENEAAASLNLTAEMVIANAFDQSYMKVEGQIGNFMVNFKDSELVYGKLSIEQSSINIQNGSACGESKTQSKSKKKTRSI